jgi:hypothetical protein
MTVARSGSRGSSRNFVYIKYASDNEYVQLHTGIMSTALSRAFTEQKGLRGVQLWKIFKKRALSKGETSCCQHWPAYSEWHAQQINIPLGQTSSIHHASMWWPRNSRNMWVLWCLQGCPNVARVSSMHLGNQLQHLLSLHQRHVKHNGLLDECIHFFWNSYVIRAVGSTSFAWTYLGKQTNSVT